MDIEPTDQRQCSLAQMRFSNRLKDDDGNIPVRTLPVDLIAAILAGEARPEALALLEGRLPSPCRQSIAPNHSDHFGFIPLF
jgi:hypothetical protein